MGSRKPFWAILLTGAVLMALLGRFAFQGRGPRSLLRAPEMSRPSPESRASDTTVSPSAPTLPAFTPSASDQTVAAQQTAPADQPKIESNAKHLRDSSTRLNAIDALSNFSDLLFQASSRPASWSVNQQDLDQIDYRSADGSTEITKWFGDGEPGKAHLRAEEAQLPNGEVVDRWYHSNGNVKQIEHRHPDGRSNSVYYYDNGSVEATRSARGEHEVFTKYDRDGREIERSKQ